MPGSRPVRVGTDTVSRYIREAVDLPAALAPTLAGGRAGRIDERLRPARRPLLIADRVAADRPFHSGRHKRHGVNVQVIADPFGRLLRASPALLGSIHDARRRASTASSTRPTAPASTAGSTRHTRVPAAPSRSPSSAVDGLCHVTTLADQPISSTQRKMSISTIVQAATHCDYLGERCPSVDYADNSLERLKVGPGINRSFLRLELAPRSALSG